MYFMICFLTILIWEKKTMKIVTYQENKMVLFCHHTKSHQCCSVAFVGMWGVCLQDLPHSLWIVWRDSVKTVCLTLLWSSFPNFFHVSEVFWLHGNRVINFLSDPLNRLLCECATRMIWVRVPIFLPFSRVVSSLSGTLDLSRIIGEI